MLISVLHGLWIALVLALAAWWGKLVLALSERLAHLEHAPEQLERARRMVFWEGSVFFLLIVAISFFLFWLTRREQLRIRSLQAFFASLTHELRTPLSSIRLQAEMLLEKTSFELPEQRLLNRMIEDTVRLETQVERALELARARGGGKLSVQPIRVHTLFERMLGQLQTSFGAQAQLTLTLPEQLDLECSADPHALLITLRNCVENSIRHSGVERPTIHLHVGVHAGTLLITIRDSGTEAELSKQLGTLFHKGARSSGAGVGLYLVRTLLDSMGGRAEFVRSPLGGLETRLTLQLHRELERAL